MKMAARDTFWVAIFIAIEFAQKSFLISKKTPVIEKIICMLSAAMIGVTYPAIARDCSAPHIPQAIKARPQLTGIAIERSRPHFR